MNDDFLKVMIVDDEEMVRGLFKLSVDWQEIGMAVVAEASNASEALDMIEEIMPDIIFTDICMPFIDGLEFSRLVVERYPHIRIVVLTAYEEFDYAKKGIKVGLSDFLLKPMNGTEIKKVALSLKDKIEKERRHNDEYNRLKKTLSESYEVLLERFLNELLAGLAPVDELSGRLAYFSIDSTLQYHRVAVVEALPSRMSSGVDEEDRLILGMQCVQMIKQYFKDDAHVYVFLDLGRRIVVLINDPEMNLVECLEQIKVMLVNRLKCYVSIGIGNPCATWSTITSSYKEARDALDYRVLAGWNHVVDFNEISCNEAKSVVRYTDTGGIGNYIKSGARDKAEQFISQIFLELPVAVSTDIDQIRIISSNIISSVLNALYELGINYSEAFDKGSLPYAVVYRMNNLPDMRGYVKDLAVKACEMVEKIRSGKDNNTIRQIMDYMNEHLGDQDLSLVSVAGKFYKNASYLSRVFKQETGRNFIEHLIKLRMEKSLELLGDTEMKSYEIAEAVGFKDPNYFSICFKKFTGMSVNAYKKQAPKNKA